MLAASAASDPSRPGALPAMLTCFAKCEPANTHPCGPQFARGNCGSSTGDPPSCRRPTGTCPRDVTRTPCAHGAGRARSAQSTRGVRAVSSNERAGVHATTALGGMMRYGIPRYRTRGLPGPLALPDEPLLRPRHVARDHVASVARRRRDRGLVCVEQALWRGAPALTPRYAMAGAIREQPQAAPGHRVLGRRARSDRRRDRGRAVRAASPSPEVPCSHRRRFSSLSRC